MNIARPSKTMQPLQTKQDVLASVRANHQTLQTYGVDRLGIFGSFQRDEMNENSDVDVFVVFEPGRKTFRNFMELCFFLEDLFGRKVDLITPESLSQHFGENILREVEYVAFS